MRAFLAALLIVGITAGCHGPESVTASTQSPSTSGNTRDVSCGPTGNGVCYYVDAARGNDANPGSSSAPFQTPQRAADLVNPGDVVVVRDGMYTSTSDAIIEITRGGSPGALIVFRAEHQWGAVLDGRANATADGVHYRASYVRVEGFEIRGVGHDGIDMGEGYTDVQAARNNIHDVGRMCAPPTGWGLSGLTTDDHNVVIEQNVFHDIGRFGPGENGCVPPTPYYQNNDHGIYLSSGSNVIIRNNLFYSLTHGWAIHRYNLEGAGVDQAYIVNNTFAFPNPYRDGQIVIGSPLTNSVIANNIFYQPATAGILFDSAGPMRNVQIANNVTYGGTTATGPNAGGGATLSGNMDNTDPRLVNPATQDFHLNGSSPAIGGGIALSYVTNDFSGTVRPNGSEDVGAFEH